jgi:hypothetical protein
MTETATTETDPSPRTAGATVRPRRSRRSPRAETIGDPAVRIAAGTTGNKGVVADHGRKAAIVTTEATPVIGTILGTVVAAPPAKSVGRCARSAGSGRSRSASKR